MRADATPEAWNPDAASAYRIDRSALDLLSNAGVDLSAWLAATDPGDEFEETPFTVGDLPRIAGLGGRALTNARAA